MSNAFDTLREAHHAKARLIAAGHSLTYVASVLATSERALERLAIDPAFRDLVARYRRANASDNASQRFASLCAIAA